TMPPFFDDPGRARPYFGRLRELRETLMGSGVLTPEMSELSMGMSGDFEAAGLVAIFQFDISGEEAGQWHLIVKDQQCQIVEGSHNGPNVTYNMASNDFIDMMTGKLSGQA